MKEIHFRVGCRLFPTSKSKSAGVVYTFVDWVLVTVSVYAEVEIDPQFFVAEIEWIFKGLDRFIRFLRASI